MGDSPNGKILPALKLKGETNFMQFMSLVNKKSLAKIVFSSDSRHALTYYDSHHNASEKIALMGHFKDYQDESDRAPLIVPRQATIPAAASSIPSSPLSGSQVDNRLSPR